MEIHGALVTFWFVFGRVCLNMLLTRCETPLESAFLSRHAGNLAFWASDCVLSSVMAASLAGVWLIVLLLLTFCAVLGDEYSC